MVEKGAGEIAPRGRGFRPRKAVRTPRPVPGERFFVIAALVRSGDRLEGAPRLTEELLAPGIRDDMGRLGLDGALMSRQVPFQDSAKGSIRT